MRWQKLKFVLENGCQNRPLDAESNSFWIEIDFLETVLVGAISQSEIEFESRKNAIASAVRNQIEITKETSRNSDNMGWREYVWKLAEAFEEGMQS